MNERESLSLLSLWPLLLPCCTSFLDERLLLFPCHSVNLPQAAFERPVLLVAAVF